MFGVYFSLHQINTVHKKKSRGNQSQAVHFNGNQKNAKFFSKKMKKNEENVQKNAKKNHYESYAENKLVSKHNTGHLHTS